MGTRHTRTVRFPEAIDTVIVDGADAAGYPSVSAYVVDLVTRALEAGLAPEPVAREHLPLTA
jgi:hypothetical protein